MLTSVTTLPCSGSEAPVDKSVVYLIVCAVVTAAPHAARAQSAQTASPRHVSRNEHVFVGGGVQNVTVGRSGGTPTGEDFSFVELAGRAGRFGGGAEFIRLGSVRDGSYTRLFESDAEERESVLLFLARLQVLRRGPLSLDFVFGAGVAWQHESVKTTYHPICCFPTPPDTSSVHDRKTPALAVGVDAPVRLVRFLAVVPQFRLYDVEPSPLTLVKRPSARPRSASACGQCGSVQVRPAELGPAEPVADFVSWVQSAV
jgi:hypothetical protein